MIRKIVIIGPESTGKSTLCQQLATHYNTLWCPEYARGYLLDHGIHYNFEDLASIARGQLALEDEMAAKIKQDITNLAPVLPNFPNSRLSDFQTNGLPDFPTSRLLFIDTDMYVMKVWCEFVFGQCHPFILDEIAHRKYDFYLLCNTDLPWVKDELRECPELETREALFKIYKDIMVNQNTPWVEIKGSDEDRLQMAIAAIDQVLNK